MPIDYGDDQARKKNVSFLLLDNHKKLKTKPDKDVSDSLIMQITPANNVNLFTINGIELKRSI